MNIDNITNNLAPINFILAKDKKDLPRIDITYACSFYFPETEKHEDDMVKWLAMTIKYYKDRKVVIYTFNDKFINTIGHWVGLGKIPPDYAKIFLINEEDDSVRVSTFDSEGVLENWPFGWFMSDIETVERADLG